MRWWSSVSKAYSNSRSINLSLALSRPCVRVFCLLAALLYTTASIWSDYDYGRGLRYGDAKDFYRAANLFPLSRERRSGPGYLTLMRHDYAHASIIVEAIRHDPNAADLYLGLMLLSLANGDNAAAYSAAMGLKRLRPQMVE